ncbi:hypothetical protein BRADI_2g07206v3 [Brachypodium distachyon]|uniref:Uncharacterized protein n=1 Tax=Brachypodium distachyon TaxID=15368 RepID=A0A2K2D7B8_BRADI|nr:hypothetical protein BRADI_2g07206v3 [Brachypodium distachyon]
MAIASRCCGIRGRMRAMSYPQYYPNVHMAEPIIRMSEPRSERLSFGQESFLRSPHSRLPLNRTNDAGFVPDQGALLPAAGAAEHGVAPAPAAGCRQRGGLRLRGHQSPPRARGLPGAGPQGGGAGAERGRGADARGRGARGGGRGRGGGRREGRGDRRGGGAGEGAGGPGEGRAHPGAHGRDAQLRRATGGRPVGAVVATTYRPCVPRTSSRVITCSCRVDLFYDNGKTE